MIREGLQDSITPFPNTAENACLVLTKSGISCNFCYLNTAHEYEPIKRDLTALWDLLTEPGILVGDDYIQWGEVTKAADKFAKERGVKVVGEPGKFMLLKET